MSQPNTLFILAKMGLKATEKRGILESHMWLLDEREESMEYISLHKTKTDRSYKGGKITNIRLATDDEIVGHQILMAKNGKDPMQDTYARKVVAFSVDLNWNVRWPKDGKVYFMAYKGVGYIDMNDTSNI